jgi:hypothetical protein
MVRKLFLKAWLSVGLELEHLLHIRKRMGLDNGPLMGIKPEVNEID